VKILLTGKNGQIGADLATVLPRLGDVIALGRGELNLADAPSVQRAIREIRPQLIVNAAAYTAVDKAESDEPEARAVNGVAPAVMAREALAVDAAIIHYSTDYVFDGAKRSPYTESDPPDPVSAYGRTKLEGEEAIRSSGARHLILRTAWVYATRGRNFLLTILRLAAEREELRIVADQIGAPTGSRAIADATSRILASEIAQESPATLFTRRGGIYHLTAAGECSWHQFGSAIVEQARNTSPSPRWVAKATSDRPLTVERITPITTTEFPTPARRPAYSVLSNALIRQTFGVSLPTWQDQLHSAFHQPDV
jgi:dTDP-4-dehydrorhamnose reductase